MKIPRTKLDEAAQTHDAIKSVLPEDFYTVELQGFKPEWARAQDSINLNPIMTLVDTNIPGINGKKRVFDYLNQKAWYTEDFAHAFGEELVPDADGDLGLPGAFVAKEGKILDPQNPDTWAYFGVLFKKRARIKLIIQNAKTPKERNAIDHYVCAIQGCTKKHSTGLNKQ
jgi:hypothetical protein